MVPISRAHTPPPPTLHTPFPFSLIFQENQPPPTTPLKFWETDFYTPPLLGGAALFATIQRQRCIKILCSK